MNSVDKYTCWLSCPVMDDELLSDLRSMNPEKIQDCFYRDLSFGTGGLRGLLGAGTNRMNIFTVMKATRGVARYLSDFCPKPSCAVCYDSRIHSEDFARLSAAVLASMGVRVYLFPALMPTPVLSFSVRHLRASAGIMITASHNPAEYNGYKVYGPDGCQITIQAADRIQELINREEDLQDSIPIFSDYLDLGMISFVSEDLIEDYYRMILSLQVRKAVEPLHVVYSPLYGTGNVPVRQILNRLGYVRTDIVEEQELPNGHFPTCPYPNPESRNALQLLIQKTIEQKADICFATDPDCDRMGAGVRIDDHVELISGNDMGILMLDYLCRFSHYTGTKPAVAVKTIVTTDMAVEICAGYHVELRNVLTGFKFIGEQIGLLEKDGETDRFIFGFEESYGYLSGTSVRDKDAVNAAVLLCEMASNLKAEGKTLIDRLNELRSEFGFFAQRLCNFTFDGETGAARMEAIMNRFRNADRSSLPPQMQTAVITDYLQDGTGLPKSNVLSFSFPDSSRFVVRPSGTEPKLKVYLFIKGHNSADAEKQLNQIESLVAQLCK